MDIILPSTGKRVHVGVIKSMYIYMHLYLSRHFLASSIFKSFSRSRMAHNVGMAAAFGLIMIAGLTIIPFSSSSLNAAPGTTNPSNTTLTMVLSHENAELAILPSAASGTFGTSTDAETAKFNVATDNFTGYTLSLKGTDDTRQLVNTTTSSVLDSITTTTTAAAFNTDIYNNKWGFLPSKYDSAANTDYIPAPTTTAAATLETTNTANSTAVDYSLGLGARIDINKPAGDYTNTFVLTAVGNPIHYVVNFNKNTTDSVDNLPAALDASTTATSIKIPNTTPTRAHYAFTGWCLGSTTTTDGVDTCTDGASGSGTVFQPNDDFGIDQTTANITTLYAMWRIDTVTVTLTAGTGIDTVAITGSGVKTGGTAGATSTAEVYYNGEITITATPTITYAFTDWTGDDTYTDNPQTIANVTSSLTLTANAEQLTIMQNLSASECTATPKLVADNRDGEIYTIQRLADGKCWLLDNLRLDLSAVSLENLKGNTNASNQSLTYLKNGGGTSSYAVSGVAAKTPDGGTFPSSHTAPYIATSYKNTIGSEKWGVGSGKDGIYYNYCAASAGSYCYGSGSGTGNAVYDICPAGWHMPTTDATNNGSYNYLYATAYSANQANLKTALSAVLSGVIVDDAFALQNQYGRYWSATFKDTNNMHDLRTTVSAVDIAYAVRDRGFSVRCVMDDTVVMQNIDSATLDSLVPSSGNSVTLKDIRDGEKYTVTKLADGTIWMTQDLRFTGTELTPADSNVVSNITMTYGADLSAGDSVTEPRMHPTNTAAHGVWYNYTAASAGTVNTSADGNEAVQSICPAGWRLPTQTEIAAVISNSTGFNPSTGGVWNEKSLQYTGWGMWWSATANGTTNRYRLDYNSAASGNKFSSNLYDRLRGVFVRCVYDKTPNMQNISNATLNALVPSAGDSTTLKDTRDGKRYTVTKLPDGNIWMTQNLRFTGTELTPADTNVNSDVTMSYIDFGGGQNYTDAQLRNSNDTSKGVWYNFVAASAGTITGNSNSNNATQDICPKGWRLPTGAEQSALVSAIGSSPAAFNPIASNIVHPDGTQVGYADWWSSSAFSSTNRYTMVYNGSTLSTYTSDGRYYGFFIRCIYDKAVDMQNINYDDLNAMVPTAGSTTTLKDNRDDELYTVSKLGDGNVWMTQNLRFTGTELTPANTNVTSNVTMSYGNITPGYSYDQALIGKSDNSEYGVYYNYAAASAMSVTGSSNSTDATQDICPAGWRLPNNAEINAVVSYKAQFRPVFTGYYADGTYSDANGGYWWASTTASATERYRLYFTSSSYNIIANVRSLGEPVRCIYNKTAIMQNFTTTDADAMATGETKILTDVRDNIDYTVAKLADGQVWMTQNLRFTGTSLNSVTSNVPDSYTEASPLTLTYYDLQSQGSSSSGKCYGNGDSYANGNIYLCKKEGVDNNGDPTVWYNYPAATAGTITDANAADGIYSICPKGWRLPTAAEEANIAGDVANFKPVYGGYYVRGTLVDQTTAGAIWTATASPTYSRMNLYIRYQDGALSIRDSGGRFGGWYIRCVQKNNRPLSSITNMQDITSDIVTNTPDGSTHTMIDTRDGQEYTVAKINGTLWMTRNLAIGCDGSGSTYGSNYAQKTLTSEKSNVATDFTTSITSLSNGNSRAVAYQDCSATYGAWYNYVALSAGTITNGATGTQTYDICPKGWRLPTYTEETAILSQRDIFKPQLGGYWYNGSLIHPELGVWVGSTYSQSGYRYEMYYTDGDPNLATSYGGIPDYGAYARCVAK